MVGVGIEGFFGKSTPTLLSKNPNAPYWMTIGNGADPAPYAPICEGQDFKQNHDLEVIYTDASNCLPRMVCLSMIPESLVHYCRDFLELLKMSRVSNLIEAFNVLQAIDFTSLHLYTDLYGIGDVESQINFTAEYLKSHLEVTADLQKPLIITEFGKLPPLSDRNAYFSHLYSLVEASVNTGGPLAGKGQSSVIVSTLKLHIMLNRIHEPSGQDKAKSQ